MKHKGITALVPLALATVAALGAGPAAQAAPAAQGDVQVVVADQLGNLQHTIRHADGSWQRMGVIPNYQHINHVASAMVGDQNNVIVEYETGPSNPPDQWATRLIRYPDGTWNYNASMPQLPVSQAPISAVNVNGRLNLVTLTPTGPEVSQLEANGTWSNFIDVPADGHQVRAIAAVANGGTLRVVELDGAGHYVGVTDHTASGWTPVNWTIANRNDLMTATGIAAAQVGSELQVATVEDSLDSHVKDRIEHGTLNSAGGWGLFNPVDLHGQGTPASVAMTASNGDAQLAYVTLDGALFHTIRHVDGTWQNPGYVQGVAGGNTAGNAVTIAG